MDQNSILMEEPRANPIHPHDTMYNWDIKGIRIRGSESSARICICSPKTQKHLLKNSLKEEISQVEDVVNIVSVVVETFKPQPEHRDMHGFSRITPQED